MYLLKLTIEQQIVGVYDTLKGESLVALMWFHQSTITHSVCYETELRKEGEYFLVGVVSYSLAEVRGRRREITE